MFCFMGLLKGLEQIRMTDIQKQSSVLEDMSTSRAIIKLAIPATLALLAKAVYNLVDTAYIGMLDSDIALTAVGDTAVSYTHLRAHET